MAEAPGEADIRAIYHATIEGLYRFVAGRCDGDRDLAEDVTQETWLRAVHAWRRDGLPREPGAWLTTVARRILANHFRRRPHDRLGEVHMGVAAPSAAGGPLRDSLLARALASLSDASRTLMHGFHFERKRVAELAAEYGLSERAVEGRLRRARQQLKSHIESDPESEGELP